MLEYLLSLLEKHHIKEYCINEKVTETRELFYVRSSLDLSRAKKVKLYTVTVLVPVGSDQKGQSTVTISPLLTREEVELKLCGCIESAKNAPNPSFDLPESHVCDLTKGKEDILELAQKTANALFAPKSDSAFINSAEIFAEAVTIHTVTSSGGDIRYNSHRITGEFVTQAKEPEDVELYIPFDYDEFDENAIKELVTESLNSARDRAKAVKALKTGTYSVMLDGQFIGQLLGLYLDRASADYVYMNYSDYKVGDIVQDGKHPLTINLKTTAPFSADGIRMQDRVLIENGKVMSIVGATRFCRYLGIEPTGIYKSIEVPLGSTPMSEMLSENTLYVVAFSDFQCDSFTGVFGGEIRLAYLYQDGKITPVTGGSVNGNLLKLQNDMTFSAEHYSSRAYKGPKAVKIEGVTVAGE